MQRIRIAALTGGATAWNVRIGSYCGWLPCEVDQGAGQLALPAPSLAALGLEPGLELNLFLDEDGRRVQIGPLTGMLLGPADMPLLHKRERYRTMARQARAAGSCLLFFDWSGIDTPSSMARGWVERNGEWQQVTAPLPDIIYNRATYGGDRQQSSAAVGYLKGMAAKRRTRLVNPVNAFSKMDVFEALRFYAGTADLAPDTSLLTGSDDLARMLEDHPILFAKGNHGSHGSDVVRMAAADGLWRIHGKVASKSVDERFTDPDQLYTFLELLKPEGDWVIQQGIELPTIEGRVFDLRVIAQKDGQGEWALPLILVRLARAGHVAANMSQGGEPFLPDDFVKKFGDRLPGLTNLVPTVTDAARRTLLALESRFGLLGEVGIDIGVDRSGRAWIFEANTKPLHPAIPGMTESQLVTHPFEYGVYLAHQAWIGRRSGLSTPSPENPARERP